MKVLDSTVLIDLMKGQEGALEVISEQKEHWTTQINMYEVIKGVFVRKNAYSSKVIELFENIRVLPLDDKSIIRSAEIMCDLMKRGQRVPDMDCIIAGIALSNKIYTIVTNNKDHFSRIKGLKVETY